MLLGVGVAAWLLVGFGDGGERQRLQLEVVKTAGTVLVGTGGAVALLLAARRQRSTEIALKQKDRDLADAARAHALQERIATETKAHQDRVAEDARSDATERRITELYTAAVEQVGSPTAPVRLGGLYALERLAQNNPGQRQTIVNVACAYLRMPFTLPDDADDKEAAIQEREVRLAAQEILRSHLRGEPDTGYWPDMSIDLAGALLIGFDLSTCTVRRATFTGARFVGDADFESATFHERARFDRCVFHGYAAFDLAAFNAVTSFVSTRFQAHVSFDGATFAEQASFESASFTGLASLDTTNFLGAANFQSASFEHTPQQVGPALSAPRNEVTYGELATVEWNRRVIPIGRYLHDDTPVLVDFDRTPHFQAFLGPESGKTSLLRTILRGIAHRYPKKKDAVVILVDYRRTLLGFLDGDQLLGYAVSANQLAAMMRDVADSMRKRLPGPDVTREQLKNRSWWTGPELFVVVDDFDLVAAQNNPLAPLVEYLPQAKDVGLHLVLAGRTGGTGQLRASDPVLAELRNLQTVGLVGNGDPGEGPLIRDVAPAPMPPGRAVLVPRLDPPAEIRIAWSEPA